MPAFGHVFLIIGENTTYSHLRAANAPFLMGTIRPHAAFGSTGVLIVVYDEDERAGGLAGKHGPGSGGHVVCAIISPLAIAGSYGQKYYHYSLLRTLEDGFGLRGYLGNAHAVAPITSIWRPPAN